MAFQVAIAVLLTAVAILSFVPFGQRLFERISFGWINAAATPWISFGAIFILTYKVFPSPNLRGYVFGTIIIGIAAALSWWAPHNPNVKGIVQNAVFGGRDIWAMSNFKFYSGWIWGAGVTLLIPWGGSLINFGGLFAAITYLVWQSYKGHAENQMRKANNELPNNA